MENLEKQAIMVVCGTGNNGGDGLVIARMLSEHGYPVRVLICGDPSAGSPDFITNHERLLAMPAFRIDVATDPASIITPDKGELVIDAITGTGLKGPVDDWKAAVIDALNQSAETILSIDLPSGMMPDLIAPQPGPVIQATFTLTFQQPKLAFFFEENAHYAGTFHVMDIGLDHEFEPHSSPGMYWSQPDEIGKWLPRRAKFSNKFSTGHVQVIAGSEGKMGASVLCSRAAMRSGAGVLTASIPRCGYEIFQTSLPEAMCIPDDGMTALLSATPIERAQAIAIGPGMGQAPETALMLRRILSDSTVPLVIDADALNLISRREMIDKIPPQSVITPHNGEFDRLFGAHENSFTRFDTLREMAVKYSLTILLKGAHTRICNASGEIWFNTTGNQGMAIAGSGDVLSGVIASFIAQGLTPASAAICGAYIHGLAGDLAVSRKGEDGLLSGDIIEQLPQAIRSVKNMI
jgi:NAD(P)H-hydrate epimerase